MNTTHRQWRHLFIAMFRFRKILAQIRILIRGFVPLTYGSGIRTLLYFSVHRHDLSGWNLLPFKPIGIKPISMKPIGINPSSALLSTFEFMADFNPSAIKPASFITEAAGTSSGVSATFSGCRHLLYSTSFWHVIWRVRYTSLCVVDVSSGVSATSSDVLAGSSYGVSFTSSDAAGTSSSTWSYAARPLGRLPFSLMLLAHNLTCRLMWYVLWGVCHIIWCCLHIILRACHVVLCYSHILWGTCHGICHHVIYFYLKVLSSEMDPAQIRLIR